MILHLATFCLQLIFTFAVPAIQALELRPIEFFNQISAESQPLYAPVVSQFNPLLLTRGFRYQIGAVASSDDRLVLFGVHGPSPYQRVSVDVLLVPESNLDGFIESIRASPNHDPAIMQTLINNHHAYILDCPSEIIFIQHQSDISDAVMLCLCTEGTYFDAPYNVMHSAEPFRLVARRHFRVEGDAQLGVHYIPVSNVGIDAAFTNNQQIKLILEKNLPFPVDASSFPLIRAIIGAELTPQDLLVAMEDKRMEAHQRLMELFYSQLASANAYDTTTDQRLHLIARAYILDPNCPWYSAFDESSTSMPMKLKFVPRIEMLNRFLRHEMNQLALRLMRNINDRFSDKELASLVFKTDSPSSAHIQRIQIMSKLPFNGFYRLLNAFIAAKESSQFLGTMANIGSFDLDLFELDSGYIRGDSPQTPV